MALKNLHTLELAIAATARDNATGLESKFSDVRQAPAFLSYPRQGSAHYPAETDVRQVWDCAEMRGTAQAVVRAGRPGSWASLTNPARNPRGTSLLGRSR